MKKFSTDYFSLSCCRKKAAMLIMPLCAFIFSCTSALYTPDASQQTESASLSQLRAGRKLLVQKCGSCHTIVLPEKHTKQEWQYYLDQMQQKASIDNSEKELILKYLLKGK